MYEDTKKKKENFRQFIYNFQSLLKKLETLHLFNSLKTASYHKNSTNSHTRDIHVPLDGVQRLLHR